MKMKNVIQVFCFIIGLLVATNSYALAEIEVFRTADGINICLIMDQNGSYTSVYFGKSNPLRDCKIVGNKYGDILSIYTTCGTFQTFGLFSNNPESFWNNSSLKKPDEAIFYIYEENIGFWIEPFDADK